jgi:DNA-binding GntR family transcriptional regulator
MQAAGARLTTIESQSVVTLAYEQIRAMIVSGEIEPGTRLGQVELADSLGISRTPVREALRRLVGEGLVTSKANHGFRVADLGLEAVMRHLEVRLLIEPGIARLAAARWTDEDLKRILGAIEDEAGAESAIAAHDASRAFHIEVAASTHNDDLRQVVERQWIVEVGRRLLARRAAEADWQGSDVGEHRGIAAAIQARDGDQAEQLMREHLASALGHWRPQSRNDLTAAPASASPAT